MKLGQAVFQASAIPYGPPVPAGSLTGECGPVGCRWRGGYWRAIAMRISLSESVMRSPDRSTVTVCSVPVKRKGAW
jgi:hypothetical protein